MPRMSKPRTDRTLDYQSPRAVLSSRPIWERRGALIGAFAVITAITAIAFAGGGVASLFYRLLTDGVLVAAWLVAAWGIGALLPLPSVEGRGEGALDGGVHQTAKGTSATVGATLTPALSQGERGRECALRCVTSVSLGLGIIGLLTLGLGLAGNFSQVTAAIIVVVGLVAAAMRWMKGRRSNKRIEAVPAIAWLILLASPFLGFSFVAALLPPGVLWGDEPNAYDVVEYHLQVPREWFEAGRLTPLEHNVFSYFPFNVEMHDLLAMHLHGGAFEAMYLAQFMHLAFGVLSVVAVFAVVRSMTSLTGAIIAALAFVAVPWTTLLSTIAYNETGLLLYGALAIGWAMRSLTSSRPLRSMLVAGALAGLAAGVKLTAVPLLCLALPAVVLIVSIVPTRQNRIRLKQAVIGCLGFGLMAAVLFAPWAIRNVIWTHGNPVFPEAQSVFGPAHFSAVQSERWAIAHSPRADQRSFGERSTAFVQQIITDWRYGFAILPLGVVAVVLGVRRREMQLLLLMLLAIAGFWLGFTHLQGRFFVLAVPCVAIALGLLDAKPIRVALAAIMPIAAMVGLALVMQRWNELAQSFATRTNGLAMTSLLGFEKFNRLDMLGLPPLQTDQTLYLIGDAEAWMYQVPMKQLRYRTVFDVRTDDESSILEAWSRDWPMDGSSLIAVDPGSLARFHDTYRGIPQLKQPLPGGEGLQVFNKDQFDELLKRDAGASMPASQQSQALPTPSAPGPVRH